MASVTHIFPSAAHAGAEPVHVQTTLYDLIAAIHAVAGPEEEVGLATLVHLLQTSRLTCTQGDTTYRLVCDGGDRYARVRQTRREGSGTRHTATIQRSA
jgi:hypothetical protein